MMAGNPNWWSMNNNGMLHPHDQSIFPPNSSNPNQEFPVRSWSQLLLGGLSGTEDERYGANLFQQQKKLENWEDQVLNLNPSFARVPGGDVKQEVSAVAQSSFPHGGGDDEFQAVGSSNCWPPPANMPVSSPTSCITNNILNFSSAKSASCTKNQDHSSECNSSMTSGGVPKKARVQQSSAQPALKVRKEKLGDRITALHQLVSPFGKTDTASVLSEAIGYIRFLQTQIETLSSPYMRNTTAVAASTGHHQQHSFLNDVGLERGVPTQGSDSSISDGKISDLRSRGLCLVPVSCTQHMAGGADNAVAGSADYCWAPAAFGGTGF